MPVKVLKNIYPNRLQYFKEYYETTKTKGIEPLKFHKKYCVLRFD